jgi:hypothetical protein
MPTNDDSFVITSAMLAMAWVKPAVAFTTGAGKANMTDTYLPATTEEKAGAVGGPNSTITGDPNFIFASTIKAGNERTPYPSGGAGGAAFVDTLAAVECNATLILPPDAM